MATKQPFTLDGANAKVKELYALRDVDLQTEGKLIKADLKAWVSSNFALTDKQNVFLQKIDQRFVDASSSDIAIAVTNRLPITFIFPINPIPTDSSKFIRSEPIINPSYHAKYGFLIEGNLTIRIGEQL